MSRVGGENLQQEFNRGYDYLINTYSAAENTLPGKDTTPILSKGIVIDIDFDTQKNYKLAAAQPPFSIFAKIIGEDLDIEDPNLQVEKIYYAPLFSIHNIAVPEIGEEILIMRESMAPSSKGYYIGRISNCSSLNYYPVRQYMDSINTMDNSPEFKYGFSFNPDKLRRNKLGLMPSEQIESISIPMTFGDVVQQGRSQSYIRHSFNRNNKKGVLEQGLRLQQQNIRTNVNNSHFLQAGIFNYDPSIGDTATKTIHFVDVSIKRLGDYNLASVFADKPFQGTLNGTTANDRSIIANLADEIYNISTQENDPTLYRQVLGEKLISQQRETNNLMHTMLDGLTGLTETIRVLLDAFIDHDHALPKIDLNLEKTITASDRYVVPARYEQQEPQQIRVADRSIRIRTGQTSDGQPIYEDTTVPGFTRSIERPPKLVQEAETRTRSRSQKINFDAIIGGAENPRFTAPIETDSGDVENPAPLGLKTQKINTNTANLINRFNNQKEQLNNIFNKATDFLSRNQFVN